jgi:hypothetical protein
MFALTTTSEVMSPAQRAWQTRRNPLPEQQRRLRQSMQGSIQGAKRREKEKGAMGAEVTVTIDQLMTKLAANDFRCAVTGLAFWSCGKRFGPTIPTVDRLDPDGDYSDANTRVVLLGVNALRGCGSDADMRTIAAAICRHTRNGKLRS